jgi:hypothetical protein
MVNPLTMVMIIGEILVEGEEEAVEEEEEEGEERRREIRLRRVI